MASLWAAYVGTADSTGTIRYVDRGLQWDGQVN